MSAQAKRNHWEICSCLPPPSRTVGGLSGLTNWIAHAIRDVPKAKFSPRNASAAITTTELAQKSDANGSLPPIVAVLWLSSALLCPGVA
jgi:hypothetical protein